jgi:mono/diheme cytochrome c family protein
MTITPRRCLWIGTCLLGVTALAFFSAGHRVVHAANTSARQRGAYLFATAGCMRCHSITGVGGVRAPDLGDIGTKAKAGRIKRQILRGGLRMPPFGKVLKKDQVNDLVEFLTSCRTKTAPGCRQWMPPLQQKQAEEQSDDQ